MDLTMMSSTLNAVVSYHQALYPQIYSFEPMSSCPWMHEKHTNIRYREHEGNNRTKWCLVSTSLEMFHLFCRVPKWKQNIFVHYGPKVSGGDI